jgi:MFS family permease
MRRNPWIVWGAAVSFYFLRVILFTAYGVFGTRIQAALTIGAGIFGGLGGVAYATYGFLQIPLSLMIDRVGHRLVLTLSSGVCLVGALAFALGTDLYWAFLGALCFGGGAAIAYVGCISISRRFFPTTHFAYVVGLTILVGSLGGASAQELFSLLVKWADWRSIMLALACFAALVMAVLWFILPKDSLQRQTGDPPARPTDFVLLWRDLKQVLSLRQIWLAGIYRGFTLGQMLSFGYVWDIPFQMAHYNDLCKSAAINSSVLIGFGLGSAVVGRISDYLGTRLWPMRVTALCLLASMACIIWYPKTDCGIETALLLAFGFSCGGAALSHSVGAENSPKHLTATALGLVSTIAYVIAGVLQILPGLILDLTPASGSVRGVVCHYTIGQYCDSFAVFPIASICALTATLWIRESFPGQGSDSGKD